MEWNGVQHPGTHEPLVDPETFRRVQELLAARAARGTRERKHPHYLKGLLHCGVCGRRLSIQHSKGRYTYFFCLGQKNDPSGTCRERYIAAEDLEAQVEELYQRIQLPAAWADRFREDMAAEIVERQRADAAQRELLTRRLAKAEGQRRKLLDAYYSGAVDVSTLKTEQARIGSDIDAAKDRLADLDANLGEWQEILELAATLATRCGDAYRKATDRTRKQFNAAVFERLDVKDGRLCHEQYRPPFDDIFSVCEFEYETRVVLVRSLSNSTPSLLNRAIAAYRKLDLTGPHCGRTSQVLRRRNLRLTSSQLATLAVRYQAGATVYELANEFGIHRTTISRYLKKAGTVLRLSSPNKGEVDKMVRLYTSGLSLGRVGELVGFNASTVQRYLIQRGIRTRDCHSVDRRVP